MTKTIGPLLIWASLFLLSALTQPCAAASLDAVVSVSFKQIGQADDCTYIVRNKSTRAIYYAHPAIQFADAPKMGNGVAPPPVEGLALRHVRVRPNDSGSFDLACPKPGEYAAAYISLDESSRIYTLVWSRQKYEP